MALHLTPAYGRDYKSKKDAVADFDAGKDFIISAYDMPEKPINKEGVAALGFKEVNIRYKRLTQVAVVKL